MRAEPTINSSNYGHMMWGQAQMPLWLWDKPTAWPHVARCPPLPAAARRCPPPCGFTHLHCSGRLTSRWTAVISGQATGKGGRSRPPGTESRPFLWAGGPRLLTPESQTFWPRIKSQDPLSRNGQSSFAGFSGPTWLPPAAKSKVSPVWIIKALCVTSGQWRAGYMKG